MKASNKRFTIEKQSDPLDFWIWFLNTLHRDLTGDNPKKKSVISLCFQGGCHFGMLQLFCPKHDFA